MDLKTIRAKLVGNKDERAVSPVIGVILMVAITVILAAVIAAFVLDIGDVDDSAPNAQYDWESDSNNTVVTYNHNSGDDIDPETLSVSVTVEGNSDDGDLEKDGSDLQAGSTITFENNATTNQIEVRGDEIGDLDLFSGLDPDDEIEEVVVTWESDGTSTIIADHEP